jgi:hypothetical protein
LRLTVSRALEHYEAMKSKHLLGMENQRLRARLKEIGELASEELVQGSLVPKEEVGEFTSPQPEVYELLG